MIARHERNVSRRLDEIGARHEEAKRDALRAAGRLDRVRRHFQDGKLDPDDWNEQRQQLDEERRGAEQDPLALRGSFETSRADPQQ